MKNKAPVLNQRSQIQTLDWLYQEGWEDDFLVGKTPSEFKDIWEDEE